MRWYCLPQAEQTSFVAVILSGFAVGGGCFPRRRKLGRRCGPLGCGRKIPTSGQLGGLSRSSPRSLHCLSFSRFHFSICSHVICQFVICCLWPLNMNFRVVRPMLRLCRPVPVAYSTRTQVSLAGTRQHASSSNTALPETARQRAPSTAISSVKPQSLAQPAEYVL